MDLTCTKLMWVKCCVEELAPHRHSHLLVLAFDYMFDVLYRSI